MRFLRAVFLALTLANAYAQQNSDSASTVKHNYQSDVAKLRKIVINSLYSHKEIFLRELISNANDAIEKLRITSLTNKDAWDGSSPLNITITAIKDEDGKSGRLIISDTGIGMSPEELTDNLGTLAKSGTSEFLARADSEDQESLGNSNLIGAFGLGFYSSFLVADRVFVASVPPATETQPEPIQHVFSSSAEDSSFEIYPDPRGNTLGRGTEITLELKGDAVEYLDADLLAQLVHKHSSFSSTFPIYLWTTRLEEVPDEDATEDSEAPTTDDTEATDTETEGTEEPFEDVDDDEAIVEEVQLEEESTEEPAPPKTKIVTVEEWKQLNAQPPLWTRDPKSITDLEYEQFYTSFFKDYNRPISWHHFSGVSGDGTSFKGIIFLPSKIDDKFWQQPLAYKSSDVKLMVKRVFITSELGEHQLPKWASWLKVVVDADDLPLNVSRETLQNNKFLRQLRNVIMKHLVQMFQKLAADDPEKFEKAQNTFGGVLKLGAVEDLKNREKLAALARFTTNQRNNTGLNHYLENKKKGQTQIFYLSEMGKKPEQLAQSLFIEKLHARGYEVLLLTEPLDEILFGHLKQWRNFPVQDVAKQGLKFGDEDEDSEEDKEAQEALNERYKPLIEWLKKEATETVRDVVLSNRLVTSPCAIVAESFGYTANVQRMLSASNAQQERGGILHDFAMKAKVLEVNPRSPLIEGLLKRIEELPTEEGERDLESEEELKEVTSILIDGALVRSGFEVIDSNSFFTRVDRVLRRSLGVSEHAPTDTTVMPAPPVDPLSPEDPNRVVYSSDDEPEPGQPGVYIPEEFRDKVSIEMEPIPDDEEYPLNHDEL